MTTTAAHAAAGIPGNEDHHIWNNNGTYWCHYTVHLPDYTKKRVRVSLHTPDLAEARRRRDVLLQSVPEIARRILRPHARPLPDAAPHQPSRSASGVQLMPCRQGWLW